MKKQNIRIIIDVAMAISLPVLMAYSLVGEELHEVIGSLMMVLFIIHHFLNRKWFLTLNRGKYNRQRIFHTASNAVLFVLMILQPLSGILMSKYLYTFIKVGGVAATVRVIHLVCAYWCFVIMSIHAGTHLIAPLKLLERKSPKMKPVLLAVMSAVSLYGIYAFIRRGFIDYMFIKTVFVLFIYSEPVMKFLADYLSVMLLFMMIGLILENLLVKRKR